MVLVEEIVVEEAAVVETAEATEVDVEDLEVLITPYSNCN